MISALKVLFSLIFVWVCYVVITTSLQSNLFEQWDYLSSIPWMRATLWDFYANEAVIFLWICYKERSLGLKLLWLVLLFCLGSIASVGFLLIQLFRLKPGEGVKELYTARHG